MLKYIDSVLAGTLIAISLLIRSYVIISAWEQRLRLGKGRIALTLCFSGVPLCTLQAGAAP